MKFKNPENGYTEEKEYPWFWALIFGGLYYLVNALWAPSFIWLLLLIVLFVLTGPGVIIFAIILNVIYAILAPKFVRKKYLRKGWVKEVEADSSLSPTYKKCPFCAEPIRIEAIKCKHCGSDLPPPEATPTVASVPKAGTSNTERFVFVAAFAAIVFIILYFNINTPDEPRTPKEPRGKQASISNASDSYRDFARAKKEECLRKRYPPPQGVTAEQFCEAYGNVQAICKHDGKTGGVCE